jgi:hypothetical protein
VKRRARKASDIARDPFREDGHRVLRWRARVLGARIDFVSNSRELLSIAQDAFARVPQHHWSGGGGTRLRITLACVRDEGTWTTPPKPVLSSGGGMLFGHVDARNFVVVDTGAAQALIQISYSMLRHRQLVRYELVEFAAITLATRVQGLVALHAGCVGARGRGVLLVGASGAGKSTLALHAAFGGLDFLAEDSVFVQPASLCATALSAYVHAREDALALIRDQPVRQAVHAAPCIERRSGVRKREIDLRSRAARLAPKPLRIVATVVLSARRTRGVARLEPLSTMQLRRILRAEQVYAADRPGWREFERGVLRAGGFRLDRGPPADGVSSLRALLEEDAR